MCACLRVSEPLLEVETRGSGDEQAVVEREKRLEDKRKMGLRARLGGLRKGKET